MKKIKLTKGYFTKVDDDDYERLAKVKWMAGTGTNYISAVRTDYTNGKHIQHMARAVVNAPIGKYVDHMNGDPLDNRKYNLRLCNSSQNQWNKKVAQKNNTTGYKGVVKEGKGFKAQIKVNRKLRYLGCFKSRAMAGMFYNLAALWYHGEFSRLNEITDNYKITKTP